MTKTRNPGTYKNDQNRKPSYTYATRSRSREDITMCVDESQNPQKFSASPETIHNDGEE